MCSFLGSSFVVSILPADLVLRKALLIMCTSNVIQMKTWNNRGLLTLFVFCFFSGIISHSTLTLNGLEYHSTATYSCDLGYKIKHLGLKEFKQSLTLVCTYLGYWEPSSSAISCVSVQCNDPGNIQGAIRSADIRNGPPYVYGDQVEYQCGPGNYFVLLDAVGQR